jgi:Carboxypeptidase regulatory-like domain
MTTLPAEPPGRSAAKTWARFSPLHTSLSHVQTVVGLATGLISIAGALFSVTQYVKPAEGTGELVAIVRDGRTDKGLRDATVEVLTPQNAIVTTLEPNAAGRARLPIQRGAYRVRVKHRSLGSETRAVEVRAGETAEVLVRLRGAGSGTGNAAAGR